MAYQQTLDYLFQQLPMFHRIGAPAYKADLANTKTISRLMGHPENSFKSIHIAGTNGKGSTSHFLASIHLTPSQRLSRKNQNKRIDDWQIRRDFLCTKVQVRI